MTGQAQVTSRAYLADDRFEDTIGSAGVVSELIAATPGVRAVAPRVEAFALVSAEDRSFGAQVVGVDPTEESRTVRLLGMLAEGRKLAADDEAEVGTLLARNLEVGVGDEIVVLGSAKQGGVAALSLRVVGLLETGRNELDRSLLIARIDAVQQAFDLGDEVHSFAIRLDDAQHSSEVVARLQARLPEGLVVRDWKEVLPELYQAIEVDKIGGQIMYWILMVLVMFTVVNSFIMTVFERTREFGVLLAVGMRPGTIVLMLQWEAFFLWVVGAALGVGVASAVIGWLAGTGIYLGEQMEAYARQFYMPSRMYPGFSPQVLILAPAVMLVGTQLAALLPSLRLWRLKPVEALRTG
jgi:ABC-type lipoprotein release transport system permease subunit